MSHTDRGPRAIPHLRRLALLALLALPAAVLVVRLGWWKPGLLVYALACLLSVLLLLAAAVTALLPSARAHRGQLLWVALLALPGSLLLASQLGGSGDYPPIHDITTDLAQPPTFSHAPALRGSDANPLAIDPQTLAAQQAAYPDIQTLQSPLSPQAAYQRALATARALGWEVTYEDPRDGQIEAVATTAIMAFRDDVVIRLRADEQGGTRVDVRSVSRVGLGDLGANAERIRRFITQFQASRT
jgi:uncharacterized protein (DUF1499 family)